MSKGIPCKYYGPDWTDVPQDKMMALILADHVKRFGHAQYALASSQKWLEERGWIQEVSAVLTDEGEMAVRSVR